MSILEVVSRVELASPGSSPEGRGGPFFIGEKVRMSGVVTAISLLAPFSKTLSTVKEVERRRLGLGADLSRTGAAWPFGGATRGRAWWCLDAAMRLQPFLKRERRPDPELIVMETEIRDGTVVFAVKIINARGPKTG